MWRGLYTAATGMITEIKRTDTIANNLANANTTGFKRDDAVTSDFEPMLIRRINDQSGPKDVTEFKGFSLGRKETWAAVTWCIYLIYIHIRLSFKPGRKRDVCCCLLLILGFAGLQICWWGVNLLPAASSSLHAY